MPLNFNENVVASKRIDHNPSVIRETLGSARVSRADFGVAPKRSFVQFPTRCGFTGFKKVRDGENAIASTRDACATKKNNQSFRKFWQLIPAYSALSFLAPQMRLSEQLA